MSEAELSPQAGIQALAPRRPAAPAWAPRAAGLLHEGGRYLLASILALGVDYALLVALTELGRLHYLISSAISYTVGALVHYRLCVWLVFRVRRLTDRRVEFAGFFATGLLGLAVTQAVLWLSVSGLGLNYLLGKVAATGVSFAVGYVIRKMWLFSRPR
jgi:putative flippase GtrA